MVSAKEIILRTISAADARRLVKALHYSHTCAANSQLHFGVFLGDRCCGAMQFGPPIMRRNMLGLVAGTPWWGMLELNRMAFAERLPRNSESRALGVALRFIRKHYPWVQWIVSFADATRCGDGTIYRAAGFVLTQIRRNLSIWAAPGGDLFSDVGLKTGAKVRAKAMGIINQTTRTKGKHCRAARGSAGMKVFKDAGFAPLPGFQLRYIYFLDPTARARLTVPILPFSEIARRGAGMYRGKPRAESIDTDAAAHQAAEGGVNPTSALHCRKKARRRSKAGPGGRFQDM